MFSNPTYTVNGRPIGNAQNDNARKIDESKSIVAGYFPFQETCQSDTDCTTSDACSPGVCDGVCSFPPLDCEFHTLLLLVCGTFINLIISRSLVLFWFTTGDDQNECTEDSCSNGNCVNTDISCDDGNDWCVPNAIDLLCSALWVGILIASFPFYYSTMDSCDTVTGCTHTPISGCCGNGICEAGSEDTDNCPEDCFLGPFTLETNLCSSCYINEGLVRPETCCLDSCIIVLDCGLTFPFIADV